jgi:hypothetical protein
MAGLDGWHLTLNRRVHSLFRSATARSFLTIFSGQFLAQAFSFFATFWLANLYGPHAFSNLAVVVLIASILTPFFSGTLETPHCFGS